MSPATKSGSSGKVAQSTWFLQSLGARWLPVPMANLMPMLWRLFQRLLAKVICWSSSLLRLCLQQVRIQVIVSYQCLASSVLVVAMAQLALSMHLLRCRGRRATMYLPGAVARTHARLKMWPTGIQVEGLQGTRNNSHSLSGNTCNRIFDFELSVWETRAKESRDMIDMRWSWRRLLHHAHTIWIIEYSE